MHKEMGKKQPVAHAHLSRQNKGWGEIDMIHVVHGQVGWRQSAISDS